MKKKPEPTSNLVRIKLTQGADGKLIVGEPELVFNPTAEELEIRTMLQNASEKGTP